MTGPQQLLIFVLDDQRYALPLASVERVVRAVEVTPLPDAPETVLGIINIQGRIVPAISMRKRFRLPEKEIGVSDQFIIAGTSGRTVALVADTTDGIVECPCRAVVPSEEILSCVEYVSGVVKLEDGMVLIYDLDTVVSLDGMPLPDEAAGPATETGEQG